MLRTFVQTRYYFKDSTCIFIFICIITLFTLFFSYYFSLQDFFLSNSLYMEIYFILFYLNLSTIRFSCYSVNNSFTSYRWLSFFSHHLFIRLDLSAGIFLKFFSFPFSVSLLPSLFLAYYFRCLSVLTDIWSQGSVTIYNMY